MGKRRGDSGEVSEEGERIVVVDRSRFTRIATLVALGVLAVLVVLVAIVYSQRRPLADRFVRNELERRGVKASYTLESVGFRNQVVRNLVIGDPNHPDLTARYAQIQTRLGWRGNFHVWRVVARGVRLRGELKNGRVTWGEVSKLLPPPSDKPFTLPDLAIDVNDATIALKTPFGPLGVALRGSGQLTDGFRGRAILASPHITPGACTADQIQAKVEVNIKARDPRIDGPLTVDRFVCPASRLSADHPRFDVTSTFDESFTKIDGSGRMTVAQFIAGTNGLAGVNGSLTFKGPLNDVRGKVNVSGQRSRLASVLADATRLDAGYGINSRKGTFALVGQFSAAGAAIDRSALDPFLKALAGASGTPLGPVAKAIGAAIGRTASNADVIGHLRVVNFPGGGAVRIDDASIDGAYGAKVNVSGGTGISYYWPEGRLRVDGTIETAGGGLPNGRIALSQPSPGAGMRGIATFDPYVAGATRLALSPIRFAPENGGTTHVSTVALVDGPFSKGRVKALRLPIDARIGRGGSLAIGTSCAVVSFDYVQFGSIALDRTRLPVCPNGGAIISKSGKGPLSASARLGMTSLDGKLGSSAFGLNFGSGVFAGQRFSLNGVAARLGNSDAPIRFNAARFGGNFAGSSLTGTFGGADAIIGKVPILLSNSTGRWRLNNGDVAVDAEATVSDRDPNPRFYPLRSNDLNLTIAHNVVRANGSLQHPASGTHVMDVNIEHLLASGVGHADLSVPKLTFGQGLQPEELTRLTQGVVALVQGTISGRGRIDWTKDGKVTSTGDFGTQGLDLAAPFGPVTGIKGTIHFNDLLGLTTEPGQSLILATVNPGILVENGTIHYQLLPHQLVKVERGEWPFMGGRLILHETVLNFNRPTAKRLTFEVVGLDAHTFVSSLGFKELDATGVFDGVLPMIFDENGGRIVGGRLESRDGGGSLAYNGVVNRANLGLMGGIVFDALRDLRFRSMIIRLDGDLAGEFAARLTIDGVGLGQTKTQRIIRGLLAKIPLKFNVMITGPFRALIATAKSMNDPRKVIEDVLPFPLEGIPGITTEIHRVDEQQTQTQTPPSQEVTVTTTPPK